MENYGPRKPWFSGPDPNFVQDSVFSSRNAGCAGIALPKVCGRNGIARHSAAQLNLKQGAPESAGEISFT
jgi:hypothetical protein